jgi:hypothetical protein
MYNIADHLLDLASDPPAILLQKHSASTDSQLNLPHTEKAQATSDRSLQTTHESGDTGFQSVNRGSLEPNRLTLYPPSKPSAANGDLEMGDRRGRTGSRLNWLGVTTGKLVSNHPDRTGYATTFLTQLEVLSSREWMNMKRFVACEA